MYRPPRTGPRAGSLIPASGGYYVLLPGEIGALHELAATELYVWLEGNPVRLTCIDGTGQVCIRELGPERREVVVDGGYLHAVEPWGDDHPFSLLHVVTVPAYLAADHRIPSRAEVAETYHDVGPAIWELALENPPSLKPEPAPPYLVAVSDAVRVVPLLTVGDSVRGYRLAGVPDGLGVHALGSSRFELVVTHEMFFHDGAVRRHGAPGAFVSNWTVDASEWRGGEGALQFVRGSDLIDVLHYWSHSSQRYKHDKSMPLERLCSADLPPVSALSFEGYGTAERLLLGGEETHTRYRPDHGRAFAHVLTGPNRGHSWELPELGRLSYENVVACPVPQQSTVAMLLDDAQGPMGRGYRRRRPPSELYVWVGLKQRDGNEVERAGLTRGVLYGVRVIRDVDGETRSVAAEHQELGLALDGETAYVAEARFELVPMPSQAIDSDQDEPGVVLQKQSIEAGVTQFYRLEDGAWELGSDNPMFWFVGTGAKLDSSGNSRLFGLQFDDVTEPLRGGTLKIFLNARRTDGSLRFRMLDSVTVDLWGRVLVQEDPGDDEALSATLVYDPSVRTLHRVAVANPALFGHDGALKTWDEEGSGIIPAFEQLGEGWYITALQVHARWDSDEVGHELARELVERGQILAVRIPRDLSNTEEVDVG